MNMKKQKFRSYIMPNDYNNDRCYNFVYKNNTITSYTKYYTMTCQNVKWIFELF